MQFSREIKRTLTGLLIMFGLIAVTATYWTLVGPLTIVNREDNPRIIEDVLRIKRGSIYDRDNRLLVETTTDSNSITREYLHESTYSAIGYYSVRYGEGGVESAFNSQLNGTSNDVDDLETYFERDVLNIAPTGDDIRLTLDLDIQNTLVESIGKIRGAGVVINAQSGDILAMASLPTFNPNTLDTDWNDLITMDGNPFFNRVLQGQYQPGGVIYTLWLAQAILSRYDLGTMFIDGTSPITLRNDIEVTCLFTTDETDITFLSAYRFGCPYPFTVFGNTQNPNSFTDLIEKFQLRNLITLENFPVPEPISATSGTNTTIDPSLQALQEILGQGNLTITPLHVASIISAIAGNGNAPYPRIINAIHDADSDTWKTVPNNRPSIPMMTTTTSRQVRGIMRTNWQTIQDQVYDSNVTVGANIATSQSGEENQLWLTGFVRTEQGSHIAFVILLEDTKNIDNITAIGQTVIQTLINELTA